MEKVNYTADLILRHVGCQYKRFQTEPVKEQLNSVRLNNVTAHDYGLALNDSQLDKGEQQDELVQALFAHHIEVVDPFKQRLLLVHIMFKLNDQGFVLAHHVLFEREEVTELIFVFGGVGAGVCRCENASVAWTESKGEQVLSEVKSLKQVNFVEHDTVTLHVFDQLVLLNFLGD